MTGRTGGKLKPLCDLVLCVPADSSALIQEAHLALVHAMCSIVEQSMFAPPGEEGPR
jgi:D-sedoheptulose 7-phosphate isomerase